MKKRFGLGLGLAVFLAAGCIEIEIPVSPTLFPTGTSFVVKGTMTVENQGGSCLVWVGERRWPEAHIDDVLAARDRRRAGPNAPPWGLYLEAVLY